MCQSLFFNKVFLLRTPFLQNTSGRIFQDILKIFGNYREIMKFQKQIVRQIGLAKKCFHRGSEFFKKTFFKKIRTWSIKSYKKYRKFNKYNIREFHFTTLF